MPSRRRSVRLRFHEASQISSEGEGGCEDMRLQPDACDSTQNYLVPPRGLETPPGNPKKTSISAKGGAESGALPPDPMSYEPDLQRLIDVWPMLSPALKTGILGMI